MDDPVRALGIDYGAARIGLATSDELGMLAHPLETVPAGDRGAALARIRLLIEQRSIVDVVLGLPLRLDGSEGRSVDRVRAFREQLEKSLPATLRKRLRWHEIDEFFTTVEAGEKLQAAGRRRRDHKAIIDQAAAVEILQRWLDERAPGGGAADFPERL
jgi:putative Holliday junction resolvase